MGGRGGCEGGIPGCSPGPRNSSRNDIRLTCFANAFCRVRGSPSPTSRRSKQARWRRIQRCVQDKLTAPEISLRPKRTLPLPPPRDTSTHQSQQPPALSGAVSTSIVRQGMSLNP